MLFLGIDGGGTKTEAVIVDDSQRVLGSGRAGGSNTSFTSRDDATQAYKQAITAALAGSNADPADILSAGCTFGSVASRAFAELEIDLEPRFFSEHSVAFERAGYEEHVGVAVIAGTGSSCTGRDAEGGYATAGGWGAILGDDGSAYDIGRRGIRQALYGAEGRLPETMLSQKVCSYFDVERPRLLIGQISSTAVNQTLIAGFAMCVSDAANEGDDAAAHILEEAGEELGELAAFVAHRLFQGDEAFPIVLAGGVFEAGKLVLDPVRAVLKPQFPAATIVKAEMSPGEAVARLTRRRYIGR